MSKSGLLRWWKQCFTPTEQEMIQTIYQPLGFDERLPVCLEKLRLSDVAPFLSNLATWVSKKEACSIVCRILDKSREYQNSVKKTLDLHFHLQNMIEAYYRCRDVEPGALEKAITACEEQIRLADKAKEAFQKDQPGSLPIHKGYEQLCIIFQKQGQYEKVVELCHMAMGQGWNGNWQGRIGRAQAKAVKGEQG
jgi:hypothetical protein